jgi:hypothetical protein
MGINSLLLALVLNHPSPALFLAQSETIDGFVASCTGNMDGTGICVNNENNKSYSCLIIPGQVIECKSMTNRSFQCVWISSTQANYADFWCDSQVDKLLKNELSSQVFENSNSLPHNSPAATNLFVNPNISNESLNTDDISDTIFVPNKIESP